MRWWLVAMAGCTGSIGSTTPSKGTPTETEPLPDTISSDTPGFTDTATISTTSPSTDTGTAPLAQVHALGRFTTGSPPASSWSLTSHRVVLDGDGLSVELDGASGVWFEVEVDGASVGKFVTAGGDQTYPLVDGLGSGQHAVGLFRRNEGFFDNVGLVGFVPSTGASLVDSPDPYRHVIEYVGDSITAGYGDEGSDQYCSFSGDTENDYLSYAAIAARDLDAGAVVVAYSGKGVVQNYGGDRTEPMPVLYERAVTNDPGSVYGFDQYAPDAVVVNLGTNDFSAPIDDQEFVDGYVALLQQIRGHYPGVPIFAVSWDGWDPVVADAIAAEGEADLHEVDFAFGYGEGWGCDWHPSLATHDRLGHQLAGEIAAALGW